MQIKKITFKLCAMHKLSIELHMSFLFNIMSMGTRTSVISVTQYIYPSIIKINFQLNI